MKDKIYNLVNTNTGQIISRRHKLTKYEASKMNHAFALNGSTKRYIWEHDMIYTPSK